MTDRKRADSNKRIWLQLLILLAVWGAALWFAWRPVPAVERQGRVFAFQQTAKASVLQQYVADEYQQWMQRAVRVEPGMERDAARKFIDEAFALDALLPEVIPHWALLFHLLDDSEYCARLIEKGPAEGIPGKQMRLIESMEAGGEIPSELVTWVEERYNEADSQLDLPEWYYLAEYEDNVSVRDWMEVRGHRMIRFGALADFLVYLCLILATVALFWWLRRGRKREARPYQGRFLKRWKTPVVCREFVLAEMLGLGCGIVAAVMAGVLGYVPYLVASGLIVMLIPLAWLVRRLTPGLGAAMRIFGVKRPGWNAGSLFWFGVLGLVPLALIGLAIKLFVSDAVALPDAIRQDLLDSPIRIFWAFVLSGVLAPICEEAIFRGFLFGGTAERWGPKVAAVGTSAIFALLHFYSWQGFVAVFCYGLVFCWLYRRSGSLWPGIIAHAIFNFLITAETSAWLSLH